MLSPRQELKKKQFEQQRKQAAKDVRLSAYTAEADLKVGTNARRAVSLRACMIHMNSAWPNLLLHVLGEEPCSGIATLLFAGLHHALGCLTCGGQHRCR